MRENETGGTIPIAENTLDERFALAGERIAEIVSLAEGELGISPEYVPYFRRTAGYIIKLVSEWEEQERKPLHSLTLAQLRARNYALYEDILPEAYDNCYGNPAYAVSQYGEETGRALAFLYAELHSQIESVYERDREEFVIRIELFLEVYQSFVCAFEEKKNAPDYEQLRQIIYWFISDYSETELEKRVRSQLDPDCDFFLRIVMDADLTDNRYLYYYGEYMTGAEEALASYLRSLPQEKIERIAETFTEGYRKGFLAGGKDMTKKKTVNIRFPAGFERIIRQAVLNFREMGLESVIHRASTSIFHRKGAMRIGFCGADANKQYLYDHKEDDALFLDKKYVGRKLEELKAAYEAVKDLAGVHGGPACLESFGETPFAPQTKPEAARLNDVQRKLAVEYASAAGELVNQYIKGEERSFTIIAFPTPEIGQQFPEIFDAVTEINTLDYVLYQSIQQTIIDVLDQARYVRVKGQGVNRTELAIALHPLSNPQKETIFENCVADVNIPVGEVFTSPQLEGTNGTLHVTRVFLNGLEYKDLELTFTEGMITNYHCGNFESEEANRNYIRENVLYHHDSLPLGEFAIGTNTTAYVAAEKYQIADKLPILIAEKTGPHFAVGDTCYSHSEDLPVYNPDGKEVIARDNTCSKNRTTDQTKAYFNCHTDITIPYDELGELTAVSADGRQQTIIRNGRFVLPGCEELNRAFAD
ncbi:aminopeptidase [Lachnospiraceae bacterium JLR.KK008]